MHIMKLIQHKRCALSLQSRAYITTEPKLHCRLWVQSGGDISVLRQGQRMSSCVQQHAHTLPVKAHCACQISIFPGINLPKCIINRNSRQLGFKRSFRDGSLGNSNILPGLKAVGLLTLRVWPGKDMANAVIQKENPISTPANPFTPM